MFDSNNYDEEDIFMYLGTNVTIIDSLLQRSHPYNLLQKLKLLVELHLIYI